MMSPFVEVLLVESSSGDPGQVALLLAIAAVFAVGLLSFGLALENDRNRERRANGFIPEDIWV